MSTAVLSNQEIAPRVSGRGSEARSTGFRRLVPALLVFLALVLEVWVRITILHTSYELEEVRSAALKSDARLRQLRFEIAQMTSPQELRVRAKDELGLKDTAPQRIRRFQ